jgi:biopolymer transport protein ExbB
MLPGLLLATLLSAAWSQDLQTLADKQQRKLDQAIVRLAEQRDAIQAAQIPLSRQLNQLEEGVRQLRGDQLVAQRTRDSRSVELETLRTRVAAQEQERSYLMRTLLPESLANIDASLSPGERPGFGETIRQLNLFLDQPDTSEAARLGRSLETMDTAIGRIEHLIGGIRYPGKAITQSGELTDGSFIQVGPLLYFANDHQSGVVGETKALHAKVHDLTAEQAKDIQTVAATGTGPLPMDLSLGDAIAVSTTRDSLGGHLKKGGIWVYPIIALACLATLAALLKLFQIFSIRFPQPLVIHDIVKLLREGQIDDARQLAQRQPRILKDMLTGAVDHAGESIELVEEVMYESILSAQPRLERFLNVIAVTAATAPLLGLLGTVTGIIKTFDLMTVFGAGDPKPLISGISEALITTEMGLVLAIPALIIHALLARRVAGILARMEKSAIALVNGLARKTQETA